MGWFSAWFGFETSEAFDPANHPVSEASTPDALIAAGIVRSFVTDFDDWTYTNENYNQPDRTINVDRSSEGWAEWSGSNRDRHWRDHGFIRLVNTKRDIRIERKLSKRARDRDGCGPWIVFDHGYIVCGTPINDESGDYIFAEWKKVSSQAEAARRAAAKAQRDMELNEQKWNLAERILRMRRNEHGALVPMDPVEHDDDFRPST